MKNLIFKTTAIAFLILFAWQLFSWLCYKSGRYELLLADQGQTIYRIDTSTGRTQVFGRINRVTMMELGIIPKWSSFKSTDIIVLE